jgi:hypothetical protein
MTLLLPEPLARPDAPTVVGVSGGVGTSTLALALNACDLRVFAGRPADVIVCRGTVASVLLAGRVAALADAPVVAVTAIDATKPSQALLSRLQLLEPHTAAVVLVPHVPHWRDVVDPLSELRRHLAASADDLARVVRRYLTAVASIREALERQVEPTRPVQA